MESQQEMFGLSYDVLDTIVDIITSILLFPKRLREANDSETSLLPYTGWFLLDLANPVYADRRQNWHGNWEVYFYFYVSFFCFRNLPIGLHTFYTKHKLCFTTKFGRSTFK